MTCDVGATGSARDLHAAVSVSSVWMMHFGASWHAGWCGGWWCKPSGWIVGHMLALPPLALVDDPALAVM